MIVQRVFAAAQQSESGTYLLDELRRLGCEIIGPFSSCKDALQQLPLGRVQMGILSFRLVDGSSSEIERRLRSAGTPIVYQVLPGHDKIPVRLRDGRLIAVPRELPVGDLLDIIECDPDFVAGELRCRKRSQLRHQAQPGPEGRARPEAAFYLAGVKSVSGVTRRQ